MKFKILLTGLCLMGSAAAVWKLHVSKQPTSYLFAHGLSASERQAIKYFQEYQPSTGDRLSIENLNFNVMQNPCTSFNFPEIVLTQNGDTDGWLHPCGRNGIGKLIALAEAYRAFRLEGMSLERSCSDITLEGHSVDLRKVNLGQDDDIAALASAYDKHVKQYPVHNVVLYGVSRGSAATFNFLATTYKTKERQQVKAAVLESCFASFDYSPKMQWLFSKISVYDPQGIAPIKVIDKFPKDIPVLLVTSLSDPRVPSYSTRQLYHALKQAEHPAVYLLELQHGTHPNYMFHPEDRKRYETTVHAFYKKYNLDHDPELAQQGMSTLLNECQPD